MKRVWVIVLAVVAAGFWLVPQAFSQVEAPWPDDVSDHLGRAVITFDYKGPGTKVAVIPDFDFNKLITQVGGTGKLNPDSIRVYYWSGAAGVAPKLIPHQFEDPGKTGKGMLIVGFEGAKGYYCVYFDVNPRPPAKVDWKPYANSGLYRLRIEGCSGYGNDQAWFDNYFGAATITGVKAGLTGTYDKMEVPHVPNGDYGTDYAQQWRGFMYFDAPGTHTFGVDGDDGVAILMDLNGDGIAEPVATWYGAHGFGGIHPGPSVNVTAGLHFIVVEHQERDGGDGIVPYLNGSIPSPSYFVLWDWMSPPAAKIVSVESSAGGKVSLVKEVGGTPLKTAGKGTAYIQVEFKKPMDTTKSLSVAFTPEAGSPIPVSGSWKSDTLWVGTITITEKTGDGTAVISLGEAYTKDGKKVPAKENALEFMVFTRVVTKPSWFPNPFSPNVDRKYEKVSFSFNSWKAQQVRLEIYNTRGKLVRAITKDVIVGVNVLEWDGKDDNGNPVPTGLYIGQISIPEKEAGKVVMKRYVIPVVVSR
jgi:hypothetical protein